MGFDTKEINLVSFSRFVYTETLRNVLKKKNRKELKDEIIFLNVFQPAHDRRLSRIARNMRHLGVIYNTFVNVTTCLTMVVAVENGPAYPIYSDSDLDYFSDGREIAEFENRVDNHWDM